MVQLAALVYGMYVVAVARPAYVVFSKDRLEVVNALTIEDSDLAEASNPQFAHRPWFGPRLVAAVVQPKDQNDALMQGLAGKDVSARPKFYVDYASQLDAIKASSKPMEGLLSKAPASRPMVDALLTKHGRTTEQARWMPVQYRDNFWTALLDPQTGRPFAYLPIDSF
jgi:hypothetical protein